MLLKLHQSARQRTNVAVNTREKAWALGTLMALHAIHKFSDYQKLEWPVFRSSAAPAQAACSCKLPSRNKSRPLTHLLLLWWTRCRSGSILLSTAFVVNKEAKYQTSWKPFFDGMARNIWKNELNILQKRPNGHFLCIDVAGNTSVHNTTQQVLNSYYFLQRFAGFALVSVQQCFPSTRRRSTSFK